MKLKLSIMLLTVLAITGCSLQQAQRESELARGDMAQATAILTQFAQDAEAGQLDPTLAPYLKTATDAAGRLNRAVADLDAGIQSAESTADVLEAVSVTAATHIPTYGALIGLGLTTIAGVMRAIQNRRAARNIAKSVQPAVDAAGDDARVRIAAKQTPAAERIVDESQGTAVKLPL